MPLWFFAAGFAVLLIVIYLYAIFPAAVKKADYARFSRRSYAHRGLYDNGEGPFENTVLAFRSAAECGYGIEMDIQLTKDEQLVVFHDKDLKRAAGIDSLIRDMTYEELRQIDIFGKDTKIPLFSEALLAVKGKTPLVVELKTGGGHQWIDKLCRIAYEHLKDYDGDYCIESFDPFIVRWFKRFAPGVVRGQLAAGRKMYEGEASAFAAFMASELLLNVLGRPNFVAFRHQDIGFAFRMVKALGAMGVVWTVDTQDCHSLMKKSADSVIFEGYRPETVW